MPDALGYENFLSMFAPGTVTLLGGRPGMGKTSLACDIVAKWPDASRCMYCVYDNSGDDVRGLLSARGAEDAVILNPGDLEGLWAKDIAGKLIIIDYVQLVCDNKDLPRAFEQYKAVAKRENSVILVLSQLPRRIERREDKRPTLKSLPNKGIIPYVDTIAFLYRESYYEEDADSLAAELIVEKTDVDSVRIPLRWDDKRRTFWTRMGKPGKERTEMNDNKRRADLHLHTSYSRMDSLMKPRQLLARATEMGLEAIAVTDTDAVCAFPDICRYLNGNDVKVLYGMEAHYVNDVDGGAESLEGESFRLTMLVKDRTGLKNLYQMLSKACLRDGNRPIIRKSEVLEYREGLLLGSGGAEGELFFAAYQGNDAIGLLGFYDYIELLPCYGRSHVMGEAPAEERVQSANRKLVEWAKQTGKLFIIGSDARFFEPEDEEAWRILRDKEGDEVAADVSAPYYLKSTEELAEEFAYLGDADCEQALYGNTIALVDACGDVSILPEKAPQYSGMEGAASELKSFVVDRAHKMYGTMLPKEVSARLDEELELIAGQHGEWQLMAVKELVDASKKAGYPVGTRGCLGASLVAYLLGITGTNPLPPHYRCSCGYTEFAEDDPRGCGVDLPEKTCPKCGKELVRDGFHFPYETFLGYRGNPRPLDICLNFAPSYQKNAQQHLRKMFGEDHVFYAGTVGTISEYSAKSIVSRYADKHELTYTDEEKETLAGQIEGAMYTTGMHPGGLIIIPKNMTVEDYCPVQRPWNDACIEDVTTHFEYHYLEPYLVELDLLGHNDMERLGQLSRQTGVDWEDIPLTDKATMELFTSIAPLGDLAADDILHSAGTAGISEFSDNFVLRVLDIAKPHDFDSLIRVSGLSHGTDVWAENAEYLLSDDTATIKQVVGTRDDIFLDLLAKGVDRETAFAVMEYVRKGKAARQGLRDNMKEALYSHDMPEWYIESLEKMLYLFPKAHAAIYTLTEFRLAWYKLNYPMKFYCTFFNICMNCSENDKEILLGGAEGIREYLASLESRDATDGGSSWENMKEERKYRVAYEFLRRGFLFLPPVAEGKNKFTIEQGVGLRLPASE